jgi:hypothetical protein
LLHYLTKFFGVCITINLCWGISTGLAQVQSESVWKIYGHTNTVNKYPQARIAANDTLRLPFWDDFSYADSGTLGDNVFRPAPDRWGPGSETVRVNTGLNINPPTVGIATFDGVNADGAPHSNVSTNNGLADSLVSKPIDLSLVPQAARGSVWFSFFWQQSGLGEFPDAEDSIRLQFKNAQNQWITQWVQQGGDTLNTAAFEQEMIQLINPGFFHAGFQFRFQSFNRLSGAFDTWNIDYIFLNSGRTASNTAYLDRALTSLPTSPLGEFTAVPKTQFEALPERYIGTSSVGFYNLNVQLQPVRFSALVRNAASGELIQLLNDDLALSPIPSGFDRREITASPLEPTLISTSADSVYLETEFHITSGDNFLIEKITAGDTLFFPNVDFRVNDTVRATYAIHDFFAYDDGEAEFGVELNQNGGKVAYQFEAPARDLLTHVDIYFPALNRNTQSLPFRLLIWERLEDTLGREVVLRTEQAQVSSSQVLNEFTRYELSSPVIVEDTFYVGYEQQGETFVALGLDKNTNSSNKIYFNVAGAWDQNDDLAGSLMIRPVFDRKRLDDIVTDVEDPIKSQEELLIYPNPNQGSFRVNLPFEQLEVFSLSGQRLMAVKGNGKQDSLLTTSLPPAVYLFRFMLQGETVVRKVIIR